MTYEIFYICQILEKNREYGGTVCMDFKKVQLREVLQNILSEFGIARKLVDL